MKRHLLSALGVLIFVGLVGFLTRFPTLAIPFFYLLIVSAVYFMVWLLIPELPERFQ